MRKKDLAIFGAGGHGQVCLDVIKAIGEYTVIGYFAPEKSARSEFKHLEFLGGDERFFDARDSSIFCFIAVGQLTSPDVRQKLHVKLSEMGCHLPSIVSPTAIVSSSAKLGKGCFVNAGAIINAGAVIGDNCIINSGAIVEHGVTVSDHCHIAPSAVVLGGAHIGKGAFGGAGSVIREGTQIKPGVVVPIGTMVRHS